MEVSRPKDLQPIQIWRHIVKRKYTLLAFLATVLVTVLLASAAQPKAYRSTSVVQVEPQAPKIVNNEDVSGYSPRTNYDTELFYETQYQILRSRTVAELVIKRFTEEGHEDFLAFNDPAKVFLEDVYQVEPVKGSQLVRLHVTFDDPEKAARLANLVAETYIEENLERRVRASKAAQDWLSNQIKSARSARETKDAEVLGFKEKNDLVSLEENHNTVLKKLTALNESYSAAVSQRVAAEGSVRQLESLYKKGGQLAPVFDSELLRALQLEYARLDQEYNQLKLRYKERHPKMLRLMAQLEDVQGKLNTEIARQVEARRAEFEMLRGQEDSLRQQLEDTKAEALELERKRINLDILQSELDTDEAHFTTLDARAREIQLQAVTEANNARIIDRAMANPKPVKPRIWFNVLLGLVVGLVGGVGLVLVMEYLDNTIKNEQDVEEYLGVPCLGIIPSLTPSQQRAVEQEGLDLYTLDNPKSTAAECCRSIRTNLQFMAQTRGGLRAILVTSSNQREGKSSTTMRLGISMVQAGQRICIIDSDLRRPRLHKAFGVSNQVGLTSYLAGTSSVDEIIRETSQPGLYLIPSGPLPPNPAELLQTGKMQELMEELKARFDRVLLDSPPAVVISDAVVLSQMVDGVVFVVKSNQVPRDVIQAAVRRLQDVNAPLVGIIVNDIDIERGGYGYNYYYHYYQYNYGYAPEEGNGNLQPGS